MSKCCEASRVLYVEMVIECDPNEELGERRNDGDIN